MNFLVCDDEIKIVEQVSTLLQEHCMENGIHAQSMHLMIRARLKTMICTILHFWISTWRS